LHVINVVTENNGNRPKSDEKFREDARKSRLRQK